MRTFQAELLNSNFRLQAPFTMLVSGSSGAGKTTFIERIIKYNKIDPPPKTIYYHYPAELRSIPVKENEINYKKSDMNKVKIGSTFPRQSLF